jgi:fluoride exporter
METLMLIFFGGGLGAMMRHWMSSALSHVWGSDFPYGIMSVNIIGSFVMGLLLSTMSHFWSANGAWRSLIFIGLLGGFTTFSSFTADTIFLIERGTWSLALIYVCGSVGLSLIFFFLGMHIPRLFMMN